MKGFGNKQPKIVAASISVIRRAIELVRENIECVRLCV